MALAGASGASVEGHTTASAPLRSRGCATALPPALARTTQSATRDLVGGQNVHIEARARQRAIKLYSAQVTFQTGVDAGSKNPAMVRAETAETDNNESVASRQIEAEARVFQCPRSIEKKKVHAPERASGARTSVVEFSVSPATSLSRLAQHCRASRSSVVFGRESFVPRVKSAPILCERRSPVHAASGGSTSFPPSFRGNMYAAHILETRSGPPTAASRSTMAAATLPRLADSKVPSATVARRPTQLAASRVTQVYAGSALAASACPGSSCSAFAPSALTDTPVAPVSKTVQSPGLPPRQRGCQVTADEGVHTVQQGSSRGAAGVSGRGRSQTIVSLSITVVDHTLETPLAGLDPICAPFSGKRIKRVPIIRVYGVINEAYSKYVPASSQRPWRKRRDSKRASDSSNTNEDLLDGNKSANRKPNSTLESGRSTRGCHNSENDCSHEELSGFMSDDYGAVSPTRATDHNSSGFEPYSNADSTCTRNLRVSSVRESDTRNGHSAGGAFARTLPDALDSIRTKLCSDAASPSRTAKVCPPKCYFRALLGPHAAYSAVAGKLDCVGSLVDSLDELKGRSCCAAIHGVFPYFYVPLPLEAHAHPRTWLRWFCCRLQEAEQQWSRQRSSAENCTRQTLSSDSELPNLLVYPGAAAGISSKEDNSCTLIQPPQQTRTCTYHNGRVEGEDRHSNRAPDSHLLVYDVQLVWRRSLYGYDHVSRLFVQIFTLLPGFETKRLAGLLLQGTVTGQRLQPFEVHIPYTVHFLADYGLRGMDMIIVCDPLFVAPFVLSPTQLCKDDDLLLSSPCRFRKKETLSAAAAHMQRHLSPETSCTTGDNVSESEEFCTCLPSTGAGRSAAGSATDASMQPPAGVLLFASWRELWGRLSRAAAELAATNFTPSPRRSHNRSNSTVPAHAVVDNCTRLPRAGGDRPTPERTSPSSRPYLSSLRWCYRGSLPKWSSRTSGVVRQDEKLRSATAGGFASGAYVEPALLSRSNNARNVDSISASSSTKLLCASRANGRSSAGSTTTSSVTCSRRASDERAIGAIIFRNKSSSAQRSKSNCSCTGPCGYNPNCAADDYWLRDAGQCVYPVLPLSKRKTSCEIEFHAVASQIINPSLETGGVLDSHCPGLWQTHDDTGLLPLSQQPLLAAVGDYWHEEAVRATALGMHFTRLEYPVKLNPPPTLPLAAKSALQQRQSGLARQAVPQAYREQLRHLLMQVGVAPLATQVQHLTREPQLCTNHQLHKQDLRLHEEHSLARGEGDDSISEEPHVDDSGRLERSGNLPKKQNGFAVVDARYRSSYQTTTQSSRPALPENGRPRACEDPGAAAGKIFEIAKNEDGKPSNGAKVNSKNPSAAQKCIKHKQSFLFSISQEPPSPSGLWPPSHQQAPASSPQEQDGLRWLPRKTILSPLRTLQHSIRNSAGSGLSVAGGASSIFHPGFADMAYARALPVDNGDAAGIIFNDRATLAHTRFDAPTAVVVAANRNCASVAKYECPGRFSPVSAQQTTLQAGKIAAGYMGQGSAMTLSGGDTSVVNACRATSPAQARPNPYGSKLDSERGLYIYAGPVDCRLAVGEEKKFTEVCSPNWSRHNTDEACWLHLQNYRGDPEVPFVLRDFGAAALERSENHSLPGAYVHSDDLSEHQAYDASFEDMHRARRATRQRGGNCSDTEESPEQAESGGILPAVEWQHLDRAPFPSKYSNEAEENQNVQQVQAPSRMKAENCRRTRRGFTRSQSAGALQQALQLQNCNPQFESVRRVIAYDAQQSTCVIFYNQQQPETQGTGQRHVAKPQETEIRDHPVTRPNGRDDTVSMDPAPVKMASAVPPDAPAEGAADSNRGSPLRAGPVVLTETPKVISGAGSSSVRPQNVPECEIAELFQVKPWRSLSSGCTLRALKEPECESKNNCCEFKSSFSGRASVLMSADNGGGYPANVCVKEGMLGANEHGRNFDRRGPVFLQKGKKSRRLALQTAEASARVETLLGHSSNREMEAEEQGGNPALSANDLFSQTGPSCSTCLGMHTLEGPPHLNFTGPGEQAALAERPSCESLPIRATSGLSHERRQEQRHDQTVVGLKVGPPVIVDKWSEVPLLLPFYGDPLDSPLQSHRSTLVAAKVYSRSRRPSPVQRRRREPQCEGHVISRQHTDLSSAAPFSKQQNPKACKEVISPKVGGTGVVRGRRIPHCEYLSHATSAAALDSGDDISTILDASPDPVLIKLSTSAGEQKRQQQPQLPDVQSCQMVGPLQACTVFNPEAKRCYEANNHSTTAVAGIGVKGSDGCNLSAQDHLCHALSSEEERFSRSLIVKSSASRTCSGCPNGPPSNKEETLSARLMTWQFCQSPPLANVVLATCPLVSKQGMGKQAKLSQYRRRHEGQRRGVVAACWKRAKSKHCFCFPGLYTAKRGIHKRSAFASARRRYQAEHSPVRDKRTRRKMLLDQSTGVTLSKSTGRYSSQGARARNAAIQNNVITLGSLAAKEGRLWPTFSRAFAAITTSPDRRGCIASKSEGGALCLPVGSLRTVHVAPGDAEGDDRPTEGSTPTRQERCFDGKLSTEAKYSSAHTENRTYDAEQPPSQHIVELPYKFSAEVTSSHSPGVHGHCGAKPVQRKSLDHTGSAVIEYVADVSSGAERDTSSQHGAPIFDGCNAAGKVGFYAAVSGETCTPRTCAPNGPANSGEAHRSDVPSASEMSAPGAGSAGNAALTRRGRLPFAVVLGTQAAAGGAEPTRGFGGGCRDDNEKPLQICSSGVVDPPLAKEISDSSGSARLLRSGRSGLCPTQCCKSTSLGSTKTLISTSGGYDRATIRTVTETAHANQDHTAGGGGYSQLSAGFESRWVSQAATEKTAASAKAEADAAAAALAVMNYQGHRLLYGSLMVVEVLADRMGSSEEEPEGLGGPTWKDAVLAVAFTVRDERLHAACERLKHQITATQKTLLLQKPEQTDDSGAELRQSTGCPRVSHKTPSRHLRDSHALAAPGASARKRAFSKELRESCIACDSGKEPRRRMTTAEAEDEGCRDEDTIMSVSQTGTVLARRQPCSELNAYDSESRAAFTSGGRTENETSIVRETKKPDSLARSGSHGALTYHDALAVIYIDRPYVSNVISQTPTSTAKATCDIRYDGASRKKEKETFLPAEAGPWAGRLAENPSGTDHVPEAPFACSFADFMVSWQEEHPSVDARAQLKSYIPSNTQLFAVKNERELLRKTALLLTLIDPSIILQWGTNVAGLGYLLRRAAVLGCDSELSRALSRRIDAALLWQTSSVFTPLRGGAKETSASKEHKKRLELYADAASPAHRPSHGSVIQNRHELFDRLPQNEPTMSARIVLDCERLLQQEVKPQLSTLEGVVQNVLGVTLPTIPTAILLNLWKQGQLAQRRAERYEERMMIAAWRLWERRRIRSRWPVAQWLTSQRSVSVQLRGTVEAFEKPQQQLRHQKEREIQREGYVQQREPRRVHHLMNENLDHTTSSCAHNSGPRPERDSENLTWGVSMMGAVLKHVLRRLQAIMELVDHVDILPRTAELARLYGCDFHSALTRGSQFKVESVMLRATKRLGYVFASPSQKQVTEQAAPLCVPLVLEPQSGFYWSPVLVLDFQSLYPSVMIANNICFSTSLGSVNVDPTLWPVKAFGVVNLHVPPRVFQQINLLSRHYTKQRGRCTVHSGDAAKVFTQEGAEPCHCFSSSLRQRAAHKPNRKRLLLEGGGEVQHVKDVPDSGIILLPNGSMFVSPVVRQGVFPRILWDLLRTRVMIKQMISQYKNCGNERLVQLLNHRQHGLKMIANVSYGYTAASFTGHMPCAEVADAIVQAARTTLMRAIQLVENTPRWGGRVLYGDTDSLFVLVEKKSLEAAFEIGREIAYAVTQQNPPPIELQLEKVFLPCCLVSKKRYVGHAYTSPQAKPYFDAKGIESVRRDQCGCTSSVLESTLRTLFTTRDLSCVKRHLYRQWTKILRGDIPLKQFVFFKECRLGSYKAERGAAVSGSLPPQAKVAYERLCAVAKVSDQRNADANPVASIPAHVSALVQLQHGIPRRNERVPFVYAETEAGRLVKYPPRRRGCRLLDFAVSPEKVEGGGRSGAWMQLFCRGTPQPVLRNILPRRAERLTRGLAGSHSQKAYKCCNDSVVGEEVTLPHNMKEAILIRGWAERNLRRNEQQGIWTVCDTANHLENFCAGLRLNDTREACCVCRKGLYRPAKASAGMLLPLFVRYYIVKQIIPALNRLLCLLPPPNTVDLSQWYACMLKMRRTSPRLRKFYLPGLFRWQASPRACHVHAVAGTSVTRMSICGVGRPHRCPRVLDVNYPWHSGPMTRVPQRMPKKRNGAERSVLLYAEPRSRRFSGDGWRFKSLCTRGAVSGCVSRVVDHPAARRVQCCNFPERRRYCTQQHALPVHGRERSQFKPADEEISHQPLNQDPVGVCPATSVWSTTRETVVDSACDETYSKRRADLNLSNELKKADKQYFEMEALCEACAGVELRRNSILKLMILLNLGTKMVLPAQISL